MRCCFETHKSLCPTPFDSLVKTGSILLVVFSYVDAPGETDPDSLAWETAVYSGHDAIDCRVRPELAPEGGLDRYDPVPNLDGLEQGGVDIVRRDLGNGHSKIRTFG